MSNELYNLFNKFDKYTFVHSVRVYLLAKSFEEINCTNNKLSYAALLHDVGKILMPLRVLNKPASLSTLEREIIDLHCYVGYRMLTEYDVDSDIVGIVYLHHGECPRYITDPGYCPGKEVLEKAKILHTIDAFEALTADRPYRGSMPIKTALNIISKDDQRSDKAFCYLKDRFMSISNKTVTEALRSQNKDNKIPLKEILASVPKNSNCAAMKLKKIS